MYQLDKGAEPPYNPPGWPSANNLVTIKHYHGQISLWAEWSLAQELPHEQGRDGPWDGAYSGVGADPRAGADSGAGG